jgi:magnesium-transporting ATPase (P-type)
LYTIEIASNKPVKHANLSPAPAPQMDIGRDLSQYNGDASHPGHKLLADPANYAAIESDLVFVGLVGLQDPPRPEVAGAIKQVRNRYHAGAFSSSQACS